MSDVKTKRLWLVAVRFSVVALMLMAFVFINKRINCLRLQEHDLGSDSGNYAYQVDSIRQDSEYLFIDGWFFRLEKVQNVVKNYDKNTEFAVLLEELDPETGNAVYDDGTVDGANLSASGDEKENALRRFFNEILNTNTKKLHGILAETAKVTRSDIGRYFGDEFDYSDSGFSARIKLKNIDLENGLYRVVFKTDIEKKNSIQANAYIYKGELSYTNPVCSQKLDVGGTDLEEIVNNGICIVSRPDHHCDIYQYGWKLYWIVDDGFDFKEEKTYMQYQMGTTQFERLPNYRTDNDWYWANIGGNFEDHEITDTMNCGKYRVSMRDIPNGYSITDFSLGYHEDGKWIWSNLARPYYDFSAIPDPAVYGYLGDDVADWLKQ